MMKLTTNFKVDAKREKTYKGEVTVYLQTMMTDASGALSLVELKLHENDRFNYEIGKTYDIPVTVSTTGNSRDLYFKTDPTRKVKSMDGKPAQSF